MTPLRIDFTYPIDPRTKYNLVGELVSTGTESFHVKCWAHPRDLTGSSHSSEQVLRFRRSDGRQIIEKPDGRSVEGGWCLSEESLRKLVEQTERMGNN